MGGFLRTLARVGLVELNEDERRASVTPEAEMSDEEARAVIRAAAQKPDDATAPAPAAVELPKSESIVEGAALDTLYAEAKVKPSPFPAEKLLRLLDGLRVMDANTRKMAIKAMDAADDAWTLSDAVIDAERKVAVLDAGKRRLDATVAAEEQAARADLAAQARYQDEAGAEIKKQIAELEALLAREFEKVAKERACVENRVANAREAALRERARLDAEIVRLSEVTQLFGGDPDAANSGRA